MRSLTTLASALAISLGSLALLPGCQTSTYPNPNAAMRIRKDPERMKRNLMDSRERLNERIAQGEVTPEDRDRLLREEAQDYAELIPLDEIAPEDAWHYGDVYRDAGDWESAYRLYDVARQVAVTEDRRVNDNLRFARAAAHLGNLDEALEAAGSTFSAPPEEKAPILPGILLEVVPAARDKGRNVELAELLEGAIEQHRLTSVDPSSDAGQAFLIARPHHMRRAWSTVVALYDRAGESQRARAAVRKAEGMVGEVRKA